jgi:hypothetical protein
MHVYRQDGSTNGLGGVAGRSTTDDGDAFYRPARDPLEVDEDGIEMSSAPVALGSREGKGKGLVHKAQTDEEELPGARAWLAAAFARAFQTV